MSDSPIIFDEDKYKFSTRASAWADEVLYWPYLRHYFDVMKSIDCGGTQADKRRGIDKVLWTPKRNLTVQERFRKPKFAHFRQLTATDSNKADVEGDFHKLQAQIYAYGYFTGSDFIEAILVDAQRLKKLHYAGELPHEKTEYRRKKQTILAWDFDALKDAGLILYNYTG